MAQVDQSHGYDPSTSHDSVVRSVVPVVTADGATTQAFWYWQAAPGQTVPDKGQSGKRTAMRKRATKEAIDSEAESIGESDGDVVSSLPHAVSSQSLEQLIDVFVGIYCGRAQEKRSQVRAALTLLVAEQATLPFVARYRRDQTGGAEAEALQDMLDGFEAFRGLEERREAVLNKLNAKGVLTDKLRAAILAARSLAELEDLYLPFKEKKKTRAELALEKQLGPVAEKVWSEQLSDNWLAMEEKKSNLSTAEFEEGIVDLLAAKVAETAKVRSELRAVVMQAGVFQVTEKKPANPAPKTGAETAAGVAPIVRKAPVATSSSSSTYQHYFDWTQPFKRTRPHDILALERGGKNSELNVVVRLVPPGTNREDVATKETQAEFLSLALRRIRNALGKDMPRHYRDPRQDMLCGRALEEAWKRSLRPALVKDVRKELLDNARTAAFQVYGHNLAGLLLQPPWRGERVLGVDPGFRAGCKLAALDEQGQVLETGVIMIEQEQQAIERLKELISKHRLTLLAIGNGKASRETEQLIGKTLTSLGASHNTRYVVVSESGASAYSTSAAAREEFPGMDPLMVGAISIGRRLQDPLSELVKVPPSALGVGLYQKDMADKALEARLDSVVSQAVSDVGVDVNTASIHLLKRVAGLSAKDAAAVFAFVRGKPIRSREELKKVLKANAFKQSAGFLHVVGGECTLDETNVHPESYDLARALLKFAHVPEKDLALAESTQKLKQLSKSDLQRFANEHGASEVLVNDVVKFLSQPGLLLSDPRNSRAPPSARTGPLTLAELQPGQKLTGVIRNVVGYGAFVDVGVGQDGLLHNRNMGGGEADVYVGSNLELSVVSVEPVRNRITLAYQPPPAKTTKAPSAAEA